jgi:hypothetical protein
MDAVNAMSSASAEVQLQHVHMLCGAQLLGAVLCSHCVQEHPGHSHWRASESGGQCVCAAIVKCCLSCEKKQQQPEQLTLVVMIAIAAKGEEREELSPLLVAFLDKFGRCGGGWSPVLEGGADFAWRTIGPSCVGGKMQGCCHCSSFCELGSYLL